MIKSFRDNNFTPNQIKGIDITIKTVSKKFPFIKGWKLTKDYENYTHTLFINLFVDWEEYGKFYNLEFSDYNKKKYYDRTKVFITSAPVVYFNDSGDYEKIREMLFEETKKIRRRIEDIYQFLPDEYLIKIKIESSHDIVLENPVKLDIEDFIDYRLM